MKSFGRLWGESRQFYLYILVIVAFVVLLDCMWICTDNDVSVTRSGVEQIVQNILSKDNGVSLLENHYLSLEDVGVEKGAEYGLFFLMLGVIGLLFAREIAFTDIRTLEFRCTWPIKNWVRELYDYVAMLAVIVFGVILQTVILLLIQMRYNSLIVDVLSEQGIISKAMDSMSVSNQYFLVGMAYYLIAVIVSYTWITLGMSLAKNPIVGIVLSVLVKFLLQIVWSGFGWLIAANLTSDVSSVEMAYYYNDFAYEVECIGDALLMYQEFFYGIDVPSGTIGGCGDTFTMKHWFVVQMILCVLLVVGIVICAKKKDLAKGKVIYFPILAYPLSVLVGFGVFAFCMDWFYLNSFEIIVSVILGIVTAIGTCILCHPFSKSKSICLEVK